jgi:hypothetical protein
MADTATGSEKCIIEDLAPKSRYRIRSFGGRFRFSGRPALLQEFEAFGCADWDTLIAGEIKILSASYRWPAENLIKWSLVAKMSN